MAPSLPSPFTSIHLHLHDRRQTLSSANPTRSNGFSAGAKAAIALGVIIAVILISLVFIYLYTHNWRLPERWRKRLRSRIRMPHWRPTGARRPGASWEDISSQRIASVTQKASLSLHAPSSTNLEVSKNQRPGPGKFWSADEIGPDGEKANTGRSRFSVIALAEPYEAKVVKAPRPPSIFTSKTSIHGAETGGVPEIVRPSSKRVKTWNRHISAQFLEWSRPSSMRVAEEADALDTDSGAAFSTAARASKRDSKSVITNLDWMEYEPQKAPS